MSHDSSVNHYLEPPEDLTFDTTSSIVADGNSSSTKNPFVIPEPETRECNRTLEDGNQADALPSSTSLGSPQSPMLAYQYPTESALSRGTSRASISKDIGKQKPKNCGSASEPRSLVQVEPRFVPSLETSFTERQISHSPVFNTTDANVGSPAATNVRLELFDRERQEHGNWTQRPETSEQVVPDSLVVPSIGVGSPGVSCVRRLSPSLDTTDLRCDTSAVAALDTNNLSAAVQTGVIETRHQSCQTTPLSQGHMSQFFPRGTLLDSAVPQAPYSSRTRRPKAVLDQSARSPGEISPLAEWRSPVSRRNNEPEPVHVVGFRCAWQSHRLAKERASHRCHCLHDALRCCQRPQRASTNPQPAFSGRSSPASIRVGPRRRAPGPSVFISRRVPPPLSDLPGLYRFDPRSQFVPNTHHEQHYIAPKGTVLQSKWDVMFHDTRLTLLEHRMRLGKYP